MAPIRVIHLATSLHGGAGIAARRTHEALMSYGADSRLYSFTGLDEDSKSAIELKRSYLRRIRSSITTILQAKLVQNSQKLVTPISLGNINLKWLKSEQFDVLHIHSFYNLLSIDQFRNCAKQFPEKKIFVTLHDERLLTGGCHYAGSCLQNQFNCNSCPQVHLFFKELVYKKFAESRKIFSEISNLTLIAPSAWIKSRAEKSRITNNLKSVVIRNAIPDVFFEQENQEAFNAVLRICFISANLNNQLKGLDDLVAALNKVKFSFPKSRLKLTCVGKGVVEGLSEEIDCEIRWTNSDRETANVLGSSDLLVVPSLEDNLPSTMLEALASGVAVIGSNVGGIFEVLESAGQKTFEAGNVDALAKALGDSLSTLPKVNREKIHKEFSYSAVASALMNEYTKVINPAL